MLFRRATGRGSGSVVGGHAVLVIDPLALERLSADRQVSLVSGTNGKTTTTKLLARALSAIGRRDVVTNLLGANLPTGLAASLAAGSRGVPAVLEVDEAWLAGVAARTRPSALLLLNLSRDQLDRNNEVRQVAQRWRQACEHLSTGAMVVANADDPLVAWAASAASRVTWVGAGLRWKSDATGCPECGGRVLFGREAPEAARGLGRLWSGASGFRSKCWPTRGGTAFRAVFPVRRSISGSSPNRPGATRSWPPEPLSRSTWPSRAGATGPMPLWRWPAPCRWAATARPPWQAMGSVREVAGRYATLEVGADHARLLLAKNPAGWARGFRHVGAGAGARRRRHQRPHRRRPRPVVVVGRAF